jgi:hypothetical protein
MLFLDRRSPLLCTFRPKVPGDRETGTHFFSEQPEGGRVGTAVAQLLYLPRLVLFGKKVGR